MHIGYHMYSLYPMIICRIFIFIFLKKSCLKRSDICLISPSSTDKNVEIIRPDVMVRVRTPVPLLCVCDFMIALSSRLSTKQKKEVIFSV
jgi:hypothetical protein